MNTTVNYKTMSIERDGVVYTSKVDWLNAYPDDDVELLKVFSPDAVESILKISIPHAVTMRQAKLALLQAGLLDDVDAVIAAEATPKSIKIEWEYASEVQRDWVNTLGLAEMLGLTDAQLDDLFILAAGL